MVNQLFMNNFQYHVQQEFGTFLAGPPSVAPGGLATDHYKGLASSLATRIVPLYKETYEPTEFLYGFVPVRNQILPYLFFQFPVLDVKGNNIPGVANFGAVVRAPIPETYISPMVGFGYRLLPAAAFTSEDVKPKEVFKNKVRWSAFLEAVNNDKAALKAMDPTWIGATIGDFKVRIDVGRPVGMQQLAPYKGNTIITMQRVPSQKAAPNKPFYDLRKNHEDMLKIASHVLAHPQTGEEIGQQLVARSNAAMMDLIYRQINAAVGAAAAPSGT